jgi:hypothetical protein
MTKENIQRYIEEAENEETKKFWEDRLARKYPTVAEKPKPKKKEAKE